VVQSHKDELAKEYGLLCFSEDWTDPVLWTHYGVRHRGICLGFDVPAGLAERVIYQENRIRVNGSAIDKHLNRKLLLTKYQSWQYEKEWRLPLVLQGAAKEGDVFFERIGERMHLTEVVLGARCITSVEDVRHLVDKHYANVVTFQARLAKGSFNIVPLERTIPTTPRYSHVR
jgi:hypothetical protein